jgi:hypothetical protein
MRDLPTLPSARGALLLAAAILVAGGCAARTKIVTDDPDALVWVDGRYAGRGEGRVRKVGPPHTGRILVTAADGRRGRAIMQRAITATTVDLGLRSLGACLVFCWEYPATVFVAMPAPKPRSGWAIEPERDPWLLPPGAGPSAWDEPPRWAPTSFAPLAPPTGEAAAPQQATPAR